VNGFAAVGAGTSPGRFTDLRVGLDHLPDDELFAFGVRLAQLDADSTLKPLVELFAKSTPGIVLRAGADLDKCNFDIRGSADWVILGGPENDTAIDLIASGRWSRLQIEDCLKTAFVADTVEAFGDRVTLLRGPRGERAIGWLDEHTFILSSRAEADGPWMITRLEDDTPPAGKLGPLISQLDMDAVGWFAGDEAGGKRIAIAEQGDMTGLWGSLRATVADVTLDVHLRYPDEAIATAQKAELETSVGAMGLDPSMGKVTIDQLADRPDVLHVDMTFTRMIAAILIESVASGEGFPE
jgi:hypothetical protein